jgi:carbonic anhydrase/acetyltransferase-like protein (isoleucine patch superfamily)
VALVSIRLLRIVLLAVQSWDRLRLRMLAWRHPGLQIHPDASTNLASARFDLAPGARLRIAAGVVSERRKDGVRFMLGPGAEVSIAEGAWLRSELEPVNIVAFEGAKIQVGPLSILNGCHVSAKSLVRIGQSSGVGPGSRVFDSDQHDLDDDTKERTQPVLIGDWVWVTADVTVLRGVEIGSHSVIRTRSVVTRSIPSHTLADGSPAEPRRAVGDRKFWLRNPQDL